jgi:hypothetical protein
LGRVQSGFKHSPGVVRALKKKESHTDQDHEQGQKQCDPFGAGQRIKEGFELISGLIEGHGRSSFIEFQNLKKFSDSGILMLRVFFKLKQSKMKTPQV